MTLAIYIFIFTSKVLENALGTFRLVIVANGRKMMGAILQFIISLIWLLSTGLVVLDIKDDPLRIFVFCFGTFIGSYVGSYIEEKLAIGSNMLTCIVDESNDNITNSIRTKGYPVTVLKGSGKDSNKNILFIMIKRKKRHQMVEYIRTINKDTVVIAENATMFGGSSQTK